jgi:hypothetical protein
VRFRITQTDSKLKREKIRGEEPAIKAHAEVGKEVREAIRRMGNTMPEDLPPELPIKEIEKRLKPKKIAPRGYLLVHRLSAALRAISLRRFAVMPFALAFPPIRPSATAAAFLPSSVTLSSISPVAIRMTWTALPITSAGRRSPLGPRGIIYGLAFSWS